MISGKTLIDKANTKIAAGLTETEVLQLSVIDDSITKSKLTVATTGDLPAAADNEGRLVYVTAEEDYYFSDGVEWSSDFSTAIENIGGTILSWGSNSSGRLGDGTTIARSSPVTVVGGITNWSSIAAGAAHSLALTDTGIIYAWGRAQSGELGNGYSGFANPRSSPVTVIGGITNWSNIGAGDGHSFGITDTGILYAWGGGTSFNRGQLGDGTTIFRSSPVTVIGGITNWTSADGGQDHSVGIANGVAYGWGYNSYGQVGNNTTVNTSSPVVVVGSITNWSQISSGDHHNLALTDTGVLYAWGRNNYGQVGVGDRNNRSSPVTVVGGITNWSSISGGLRQSLGTTDAGVLYAWGNNSPYGRLGDGTTINRSSPVTVVGGITNWSSVSTKDFSSFGITDTGVLYAWGSGFAGSLGDGTATSKSSPITVLGGITNWSQVYAGDNHVLAIVPQTKGFNEP